METTHAYELRPEPRVCRALVCWSRWQRFLTVIALTSAVTRPVGAVSQYAEGNFKTVYLIYLLFAGVRLRPGHEIEICAYRERNYEDDSLRIFDNVHRATPAI